MKETAVQPPRCKTHHKGGGPTSYDLHDSDQVFSILNLQKDDVFVDIGCGRGDYSLRAAQIVGPGGIVCALDYWSTYAEQLKKRAAEHDLTNLVPLAADIRKGLPLPDGLASLCLLSTILHATTLHILETGLGRELQRVLRPEGRVAVIEMKKEEQPFGPPLERRLSPEQVEHAFSSHGFAQLSTTDLGYTYALLLQK